MRLATSLFGPRISLEQLATFCANLATCVHAGLSIPKSLQACHRSSPSPLLREILPAAAKSTAGGMALHAALAQCRRCFPAFFLPVLRCGEESGRLDDALRYLERHCRLLAGPARTMHNTWFVPLCLMAGGSAVCAVAYLAIAPFMMAVKYIVDALVFYGLVVAGIIAIPRVPPLKRLADHLVLLVPVIGTAQRELSMNRFFHAMSLLYSTGGRRVEEMIRLAAESADNGALRADFRLAARVIESGGTISDAFFALREVPHHYKMTVLAGDEAGKLETAFDTISDESAESVQSRLATFQPLFFRVVAAAVISSVTMTLYTLILMQR